MKSNREFFQCNTEIIKEAIEKVQRCMKIIEHIKDATFDEVTEIKQFNFFNVGIDMKTDLDKILEAENVTDDNYKAKSGDKYVMMKVQLRHELNLNDKIPDDKLNDCLTDYVKNKSTVMNILNYYRKGAVGNGDDLNSAYEKVIDALDCEFLAEDKIYTADEYDNMTKDLEFSKAEILSLNSKGLLRDKYQIIKVILDRYGILF